MRTTLVAALACLVACSGTPSSSGPPPAPTTPPAPRRAVKIGQLVTPTSTAVTRTTYEHFVVAAYVRDLIGPGAPCWADLERTVTATYQVQTPEPSSYFILEGKLPREAVERCVPASFQTHVDVTVTRDGELTVFQLGDLGATYVAWREPFVIIGERPQVLAAIAAETDAANPWIAHLAQPATAPIWAFRTDALPESLWGIATKSYLLELDRLARGTPPQFSGRLVLQYATAQDAATVATRVPKGELSIQAPRTLVDALKRLTVTEAGAQLTLGFDQATFAGLDLDELMQWASQWAAGQR